MSAFQSAKHSFQDLLRPYADNLAGRHVTALQLTLAAVAASAVYALLLCLNVRFFWFLMPFFLIARLGVTTLERLLAQEHDMQTDLGIALNELADIAADTVLIIPFMVYAPTASVTIGLFVFLAIMTEMSGLIAHVISHIRRHDGPLGKPGRMAAIGALGLLIGCGVPLERSMFWIFLILAVIAAWTCVNRIRLALSGPRTAQG